MKKSIVLLELIVSILILSIVGIYSLLFISNLYTTNSQNLKQLNTQLDFQSTSLFIENILKNSVNHDIKSNSISFYEINKEDFKSNLYSGFALLEKSSKEYVFTPFSHMSKIQSQYIWFNNNYFYEIQNSYEDDKIYFTNKNRSKRIFEQYKLLKYKSEFFLKENNLYFNNHRLLNDVNSFKTSFSKGNLTIDICAILCQKWIISL